MRDLQLIPPPLAALNIYSSFFFLSHEWKYKMTFCGMIYDNVQTILDCRWPVVFPQIPLVMMPRSQKCIRLSSCPIMRKAMWFVGEIFIIHFIKKKQANLNFIKKISHSKCS